MKIGRRRVVTYAFLFFLVMVNYMDRSALSVATKPIEREFDLSSGEMGILLSAFLWSYLVFLVPSGILTDRLGTRRTNALSIAVWSLATMMVAVMRAFGGLIGARLLMGAGEAPTYPACGRVLQEWAPAAERGRVAAIYNSGAYAGPALGAVIAAALLASVGWRTMFAVMGAVGFVWIGGWLIWFRDPADARWLSPAEKRMILAERGAAAERLAGAQGGILSLLRFRSMWGVALVQSSAVYTQYLFLTWLPGYLQQAHGMSVLKSGTFTAIPYVVAMVVGMALGVVFDRMLSADAAAEGKRRRMVAGSLLLSAVVLITPFVSSIIVVMVLISVSLTCVSTAVSMNLALLGDLLRSSHLAGRANSIAMVGGNIFGLAAPIVTGYVVQVTGSYDAAFLVAGLLLVAGTSVALTMTRGLIGEPPRMAERVTAPL